MSSGDIPGEDVIMACDGGDAGCVGGESDGANGIAVAAQGDSFDAGVGVIERHVAIDPPHRNELAVCAGGDRAGGDVERFGCGGAAPEFELAIAAGHEGGAV